jgi:hypothetical protein
VATDLVFTGPDHGKCPDVNFPADGGGAPQLRMDPALAQSVHQAFQKMSADLQGHATTISSARADITAGAGEFSGSLISDVNIFVTGWSDGLDVLSTSTGLIAHNTNQLSLDLTQLDRGGTIDISIVPPVKVP